MKTKPLSEILYKILEITGFSEDKNKFILDFTNLCAQKTLLAALSTLSHKEQEEIKNAVKDKTQEESIQILQTYFDKETLQELLGKTSTKVLQEYVETIMPVVTTEQREQLVDYFTSLEDVNQ